MIMILVLFLAAGEELCIEPDRIKVFTHFYATGGGEGFYTYFDPQGTLCEHIIHSSMPIKKH